ncbi:low molecular weight protein tyrosine phosphatase family protein [Portibacter lacus]|uniref:Protein-tyrosine-phosphatase n=1 Tax=Portibacter lacus TaxID=1099794 RepID=A0AA37SKC9_9BACT|nr:protein tyrosine phosphatase [Portibacter lacus]GLR16163.1 protein-tyrosine-phosphatase [Portibacter lacus]
MNVLFICSRNQWRSKTAETIFKNRDGYNIRSAGTSKVARIRISQKLIEWADLIFVMEKKHKKRIVELFNKSIDSKEIIVLDIPDNYKYMDEELIKNLEDSVSFYLEN